MSHHLLNDIPRVIYTFWHSRELSPVVRACVDTWRTHNPGFEIVVIDSESAPAFLGDLAYLRGRTTFQQLSDLVRSAVLRDRGGVWMDASIFCTGPIQLPPGAEFVCYNYPGEDTICPENWFIACARGCDFMRRWAAEFARVFEFDAPEAYVSSLEAEGVDLRAVPASMRSYLTMHCACLKVIQASAPSPFDDGARFVVMHSDAPGGPYEYLAINHWYNEEALRWLCANPGSAYPIVKLRGIERAIVEADPDLAACLLGRADGRGVREMFDEERGSRGAWGSWETYALTTLAIVLWALACMCLLVVCQML